MARKKDPFLSLTFGLLSGGAKVAGTLIKESAKYAERQRKLREQLERRQVIEAQREAKRKLREAEKYKRQLIREEKDKKKNNSMIIKSLKENFINNGKYIKEKREGEREVLLTNLFNSINI